MDQLETTEGHHADNNTDDLGPDQRREDEGQRAACAPRRPREKIATQLTDLETAERVLSRVSTTPSARRLRSAAAVEGKTLLAKQGRGRPAMAATSKSVGRKAGARAPSLGERVLALA